MLPLLIRGDKMVKSKKDYEKDFSKLDGTKQIHFNKDDYVNFARDWDYWRGEIQRRCKTKNTLKN